jgi:ubiquinone biosynthesis monooxygenase Coq7
MTRDFNFTDRMLQKVDTLLRVLCAPQRRPLTRPNPARDKPEPHLTPTERRHISGLLRVNHAGEVCAQALYQGQALTAKLETVKIQMNQAQAEEIDHLAWCEERLQELMSKPSILNPFWYVGSLFLGACAGLMGDQWSLGFVAETEQQVTAHLIRHIQHLPSHDEKTRAILQQMQLDETAHANTAICAGGKELPLLIKTLMYGISKILTTSSYYI